MLPKKLSFVDVETTGTSPRYNRIIEIGILRVEDNKIIDQFSTLINPDTHVDPFILSMTGISLDELETAPSFYSIKNHVKKLLSDSIFVAHNVFVIDKWCVLGSIKNESESLDDISREYLFDTDTYKILSRYLNKSRDLEVFNLSPI